MTNIFIEGTGNTPQVILNADDGLISFDGKSFPGDAFTFYDPLLKWIKEYLETNEKDKIIVNIKFLYFNSSTSQILYDLLDVLEVADGEKIEVNWYYQKDNKDAYEDYQDIAEEFESLKINTIEFSN